MRRDVVVVILVAIFLVSCSGFLYSQMVQRDIQAQLMLKILSLDRNFARFGDPIKIGVSSKPMLRALERFTKQTIRGKHFTPEMMNTLDDIDNYTVVYIDKNWKDNYKTACDKAIAKKILMFAGEAEAVERGDAGVAFKTVLGKPKIMVHLETVKQQGANFPANFLQMTLLTGNL